MSTEGNQEVESFVASGDMSALQYHILDFVADRRVGHALANRGFGILLNKPKSTEFASVATSGRVKVRAGAAMTVGSLVVSAASGWGIAATGPTANPASGGAVRQDVFLGRARTACASGSLFEMDLDPQFLTVASA
jgi:hypothetical protein